MAIGCGARRSQLPPHDAMYLFQVVQQQEQRTVSSSPPAAIPSNRMPFPSPPSLDLYFPKSNAFGQQQQQQQQQHGIDIMSVGSSSSQSSVQGNRLVSAKYARAVHRFEEEGGRAQPRHIQLQQQQQQQHHRHHHQQQQQQPLTEGETKMRLS